MAMALAGDQTVRGDFNNSQFSNFGVKSRFFKKDGKFFVNTETGVGGLADFEIKYTFGIRPLQQYLIEFPGGRLQTLGVAWDTNKKNWFHLYQNERIGARRLAALDKALSELEPAAMLLPDRPRVQYNYAVALEQTGKMKEAERRC